MQNPPILNRPNEHDNDKAYWDTYEGGTTQKLSVKYRHHLVVNLIADSLKDNVVLDLGCGFGRTNLFFDIGEYHGLDTSSRMLKNAIRLNANKKNAYFHTGNGKTLTGLKDEYFDCVMISTVALHLCLSTLESYAKEIFRVLKPRGICIANFPKKMNPLVNLEIIFAAFSVRKLDAKFFDDDVYIFSKEST